MKKLNLIVLIVITLFSTKTIAQDYTSFEVNNVPNEIAREAINKTLSDLNLGGHIWKNKNATETNFYNYSTLIAKNRLKFKVLVKNDKILFSIFNRQYKSNGSWVDNPMPMNKKKAAKILKPIKKKLLSLLPDNKN